MWSNLWPGKIQDLCTCSAQHNNEMSAKKGETNPLSIAIMQICLELCIKQLKLTHSQSIGKKSPCVLCRFIICAHHFFLEMSSKSPATKYLFPVWDKNRHKKKNQAKTDAKADQQLTRRSLLWEKSWVHPHPLQISLLHWKILIFKDVISNNCRALCSCHLLLFLLWSCYGLV